MENLKFMRKDINGNNVVSGITLISLFIISIILGVSISILMGRNGIAAQANTAKERKIIDTTGQAERRSGTIIHEGTLENDDTKSLKIMEKPPEITIYEEDITSSPYKLKSVQLNGEVNPIYTSYNSILAGNGSNIIGRNGITNDTSKIPNSYTIEFTVDCKDFVFRSSSFFRISVDEGNGYELVSYEGFTEQPYAWSDFKVEFSEKKKRNIKIELTLAFWGVYLRDTDTISKLERESDPRALFVGTSITQGVYKYSNICNTIVGYPNAVCNILGLECMNNGIGGTGYLTAGNFNTFYDRLVYAVENLHPDIIFIEGGPNDVDRYDNDDIIAEAERCHAYIKENAPDTRVIIIGLYHHTGYEYLPEKHLDLNTKLRGEALKYGIPYIDLLTGDTIAGDGTILTEGYISKEDGNFYITGNGNISNKTGNGNADIYVDSDNYHPTVDGYRFLGIKLSVEIEKIIKYDDEKKCVLMDLQLTKAKTVYTQGETLNVDDLKVMASYSSNSGDIQKELSSGAYTTNADTLDMNIPGRKTLTVFYTEGDITKTADIIITINEKRKEEPIKKPPEKGEENQPVKVTKLTVITPSKKLAAGKKVQLTANVFPANATDTEVTWKTSNKKYATVDAKGRLTLKKAGIGKIVTITATAKDGSGKKASIKIKIMKDAVKSIKVTTPQKTLKAEKTVTLKATVKTTGKRVNRTLKWQSSNTKFATVNKNGKVTAKKAGKGNSVIITAVSTDGSNKKARVKIKIK